uniref:U6 snRNA-associated Sm-like protein LSm2 n=1 Tax=Agelaius phoeniceus TaxID=39638 RepID=UPI0023ECDB01
TPSLTPPCPPPQLFYSFFKSLVGKDVVVELKNDLSICGTLHSVDQYLNIKLTDISVTDPEKYPHMLSVKNCFIRGSVVRCRTRPPLPLLRSPGGALLGPGAAALLLSPPRLRGRDPREAALVRQWVAFAEGDLGTAAALAMGGPKQ